MRHMWAWEMWCAKFSDEDLKLVIKFIKEKLSNGRPARSFTFRNLIGGPNSIEYFEEDLCEARAHFRGTRVDPDKASVLRSTYRSLTTEKPAMSAAEVIGQHSLMASMLKNFKEAL